MDVRRGSREIEAVRAQARAHGEAVAETDAGSLDAGMPGRQVISVSIFFHDWKPAAVTAWGR